MLVQVSQVRKGDSVASTGNLGFSVIKTKLCKLTMGHCVPIRLLKK